MTNKELIKNIIEEWELPIKQESENGFLFRYQMSYINVNAPETPERNMVNLNLAGIFHADDEREMILGLRICNDINFKIIHVKAYMDEDADLVLASEFFFQDEEDLETIFTNGLETLMSAKKRFRQKYEEFDQQSRLFSQRQQN